MYDPPLLPQNVLAVDPGNAEATAYLEAAERWLAAGSSDSVGAETSPPPAGEGRGEGEAPLTIASDGSSTLPPLRAEFQTLVYQALVE